MPQLSPACKISMNNFVTMLVPYKEDRKDWERVCREVLGPAPYQNTGRPMYPNWVNIVIEATYFGEGSDLRIEVSASNDLLRSRGTRFLKALLGRTDLVSALATIRALGSPTSAAQFLESIS